MPVARAWAVDAVRRLYGGLGRDAVADIALIVSELVTNSLNAHTRALGVSLELHRYAILVATTDNAPGEPTISDPGPTDPHGRGLQIIAATAEEWGVEQHGDEKRVWALLAVPDEVDLHFACAQTD